MAICGELERRELSRKLVFPVGAMGLEALALLRIALPASEV